MSGTEKIECEVCKKEIPKSVAISVEGADYVHHFCCPQCRDHYLEVHAHKESGKK